MGVYRDILKHSAVYGLGEIIGRLASILLLPVYTRFLTVNDYGIIAIVDLFVTFLSIVMISGLASAVARYHFDDDHRSDPHALWTTGLAAILVMAPVLIAIAWPLRGLIAGVTFGPDVVDGALYVGMALFLTTTGCFVQYAGVYLRMQKRSGLYVTQQVTFLLLKIFLNVKLICFDGYGVLGFFYSNVAVGTVQSVVLLFIAFRGKPFQVRTDVFRKLAKFGSPVVISGLASLAMHQIDRPLLLYMLGDLGLVGIYSLAYTLVHAVNSLVLLPFDRIWKVSLYEIDQQSDREIVFRAVFKYFVLVLTVILVGVALFSDAAVRIIAAPEFHGAADVVPLLCLAFLLFPLHTLFSAPALIHKRTQSVATTALAAAVANVLLNCWLIPIWGVHGAAAASVATYLVYAFFGHWQYRGIEDLRFPLRYLGFGVVVGTASVLLWKAAVPDGSPLWWSIAMATLGWLLTVLLVVLGPARELLRQESPLRKIISRRRRKAVESVQ